MIRAAAALACLLAAPFAQGAEQDWPSTLSSLFSGPEPANLTAANIHRHFAPTLLIDNYSRDRCTPVLKATQESELSVAASFFGTTLYRPCEEAGRIIIMKFQFRDKEETLAADVGRLREAMLASNGAPCFDGAEDGGKAIYWSNRERALLLANTIDEGSGFTITYFSRLSVTPSKTGDDRQVYELWNRTLPVACQTP